MTVGTDYVGTPLPENQHWLRAPAQPHRFPEKLMPVLIFAGCFAYLCLFLRYSTLEPDEGIVLQGAEHVVRGEIPYRDFFSFYTPGSFYLVASLFRLFGDSFAVARMSLVVTGAVCSVVTYILARRLCPRGIALVAAVLATTAGTAFRFLVLHNLYSTFFCCVALYAAVRFCETRARFWAFTTGSLASLTFLFEQSKGVGICVSFALSFLLLRLLKRTRMFEPVGFLLLSLGLTWPILVTIIYFCAHRSCGVMLQDWLWPLRHYTQANHVPYGYQNWSDQARKTIFHTGPIWLRAVQILIVSPDLLIPVLPLVAVAILAYETVKMRRTQETRESNNIIVICSVLTGLLASVVVVRPDILHFMYLAPLWYIVLAWILGATTFSNRLLNTFRPMLIAYTLLAFGLLSLAMLSIALGAHNRIETRRGVVLSGDKDTVLPYLQAHTVEGEQLLSYPYLPLYNYLTATRSPTHFDYFQPGMNTDQQADEIVAVLQTEKPPAILFEPWFPEKFASSWPGTPLKAIATDPVADFIVQHYRVCMLLTSASNWRFHYLVRSDISCP